MASLAVRPGIAERVGADEQAEPDALGQDASAASVVQPSSLRVVPVALVGEQVVVEPERVPAGALDRAGTRRGAPASRSA